jgi:hypothetical protein
LERYATVHITQPPIKAAEWIHNQFLNCWGFTPYRWTLPVPVKTGLSAILQHDDIARRSLAAVLLEFCIANLLSYVMSSSSTMFKLNFYYSREIKH